MKTTKHINKLANALVSEDIKNSNYWKEKDRQKDIELALIGAEAKKDVEGNNLNLERMVREFEIKERELDLREKELNEKMRGSEASESIARESNQVKREDSQIKKEIANKNANKRN